MNNLIRRLKYSGIGFALGLIIVFFFFGNRGCNWGPESRVKTAIKDRVLVVNQANELELQKKGVSIDELRQLIEDSDIDFSASKKEEALKVYYFENEKFDFVVSLPYESYIAEISLLDADAQQFKTSSKGNGKILHFPKDQDLFYVPENSLLTCQMNEMGFKDNNALFEAIKTNGVIDFSSSNFNIRPKAEHLIRFKDKKNRNVAAKTIWMKEKIEVVSFTFDTIIPCK
ncbi:MAG: hypothetical protein ACKO1R_07790 [Crocinitomicaceae bacterium]